MYTPYFESIKTLITSDTRNPFKLIDYYNEQYQKYKLEKAKRFPHLFVEFPGEIVWEEMGNKAQHAPNTDLIFHVVNYDVKDSPGDSMGIAHVFNKILNHQILMLNDEQLSTSLVRSTTELLSNYDQLKVMKIKYSTCLYEARFMDEYEEVSDVNLVVSDKGK